MKTLFVPLFLAVCVFVAGVTQAQKLVAVTPYGPNPDGIPADQPRTVRSIAATNELRAGEVALSADELKAVTAKNRETVKAVADAKVTPEPPPAPTLSELLERLAALEAKVAAIEAKEVK